MCLRGGGGVGAGKGMLRGALYSLSSGAAKACS